MSFGNVHGSMLRKVRTPEEFVSMVKELREDVFDLREACEYAPDEMGRSGLLVEPLEEIVEALYQSFVDGTYEFKDEDLPYMSIVKENNHTALLPMLNLLKEVNRIHREGLDID